MIDERSKRFLSLSLLLIFTFLFAVGLWKTDVASSALERGTPVLGISGYLDANFSYHLGIGIAMSSFLAVAILALYATLRN